MAVRESKTSNRSGGGGVVGGWLFLGHFWVCVVNAYGGPGLPAGFAGRRYGAGGRGFPWVVGHCQLSGTKGERVFARNEVKDGINKACWPAARFPRCICLRLPRLYFNTNLESHRCSEASAASNVAFLCDVCVSSRAKSTLGSLGSSVCVYVQSPKPAPPLWFFQRSPPEVKFSRD